jgi:nucleoside 2-deoxyribosyltransferase
MFAVCDGLDSGTIYEVGYARALQKPVLIYCEALKSEDLKMMEGSGCQIFNDYVTAIYQTAWTAGSQ